MHIDIGACNFHTWGQHEHYKRVCTGSQLWEKNPLLRQGLEPTSVLRLAFQSDALPTELPPPLEMICEVVSACANDLLVSVSPKN